MLSISNVREINRQITNELRNVDSIHTSPQEKIEALERIDALQEILSNRPEVKKPSKKRKRRYLLLQTILNNL